MKSLPLLTAVLALSLTGCGQPLPAERMDYAGTWEGGGVTLEISPGGRVRYEKKSDNTSVSLDAPVNGWEGDSFTAGLGPLSSRFDVQARPHQEQDGWHMKVDGLDLARK